MSRGHTTLDADGTDPDTGAAAYWNFGVEEVATEDIPAIVTDILEYRSFTDECQKVQIVGHDEGSNYAMIML